MPKYLSEIEPRRSKDGRFIVGCYCGWTGKRRLEDCCCYDTVCSPESPGSGCPRGWARCPKCGERPRRLYPKTPKHEHCWGKSEEVPGIGVMQFCKNDYCPDIMRHPKDEA